jgi:hypothetical protein
VFDRTKKQSGGFSMNKYGHSEMEERVLNTLKQEYGNRWEAIDEKIVLEKIQAAKLLYQMATDEYFVNQSAKNYNLCITAMIALQYWNQKRVKLFSLTEDF